MSTARSVLRGLIAENLGGGQWLSLSTTSQGGAGGINAICASLIGQGDDAFNNWWAALPTGPTNGSGSYEDREISDFTSASGTIVVSGIRSFSAQVASGQSMELHRYAPELYYRGANRAIRTLFPNAELPVRNETLVVDNRLQNWDFETFATTFANWTNFGTPTLAAQTAAPYVWHGAQSAKITSAGGAASGIYQDITGWPTAIQKVTDKSVTFKCWVWCATATAARLRLSFDSGSTFTNGDYHTGADQWEFLEVTASAPSAATTVRCYCEVAAGALVAYFDNAWASFSQSIYRYTIPTALVDTPSEVSQQLWDDPTGPFERRHDWHVEEDGATRYLALDSAWTPGRIIRITGRGLYTAYSLTDDTSTSEFDQPRAELVAAKATAHVYEQLVANDPLGVELFHKLAREWHVMAEDLSHKEGIGRTIFAIPRRTNFSRT